MVFNDFYQQVFQSSQNVTNHPTLPWKRKIPHRIDEGAAPHQYEKPKEQFRQKFFEVLDWVTNEISRQFSQSDLAIVGGIEGLILTAGNGGEVTIPEPIHNTYKGDFNIARLSTQLKMLPDFLRKYHEITENLITKSPMLGQSVR